MRVVVEIEGREALVLWTLPYVTSWRLSPDMLLKRLVDPIFENELPSWQLSRDMQQRKLTDPTYRTPLPFPLLSIWIFMTRLPHSPLRSGMTVNI